MVVGRAPGGGNLVVGGGDGGALPPEALPAYKPGPGVSNDNLGAGTNQQVGYGLASNRDAKSGGLGEPLGS